MNLYLVQHGKARDKSEDPQRSLSERGIEELRWVSTFLDKHQIIDVETIYHSGKLRAQQTAEVLAKAINPPRGLEIVEGLAPMDNPEIWADRLSEMPQDVMLVGHLPHMSFLASLLITGDVLLEIIQVRNGGIICLNRDPDNTWTIEWIITPYMLA